MNVYINACKTCLRVRLVADQQPRPHVTGANVVQQHPAPIQARAVLHEQPVADQVVFIGNWRHDGRRGQRQPPRLAEHLERPERVLARAQQLAGAIGLVVLRIVLRIVLGVLVPTVVVIE